VQDLMFVWFVWFMDRIAALTRRGNRDGRTSVSLCVFCGSFLLRARRAGFVAIPHEFVPKIQLGRAKSLPFRGEPG
jgi:hypothetical protein